MMILEFIVGFIEILAFLFLIRKAALLSHVKTVTYQRLKEADAAFGEAEEKYEDASNMYSEAKYLVEQARAEETPLAH